MRKNLPTIFCALLLLSLLVGCSAERPAENSAPAQTTTAAETIAAEQTAAYDADSIIGTWRNIDSSRCLLTISKTAENDYLIVAEWANSVSENTVWTMNAAYDTASGQYVYTNGMKQIIARDEAGQEKTDTLYTNGSGKLYLAQDGLYWIDDIEAIRDGCPFAKEE